VGSWLDGFWQPKRLKARDALKTSASFLGFVFIVCLLPQLQTHFHAIQLLEGLLQPLVTTFVFAAVDGRRRACYQPRRRRRRLATGRQ